jgi:alpha-L-rhamnosidase
MMRAVLILGIAVLLPLSAIHASEVESLRCEYLDNPLRIEAAKPRLSWKISSDIDEHGVKQTAYQSEL